MSATIALVFLAEAAATCSSSGASRLKAGATVVQAIVTAEPQSSDPAAPTTAAASEPAGEAERGGSADGDDAEPAQPTDECAALPIPIV